MKIYVHLEGEEYPDEYEKASWEIKGSFFVIHEEGKIGCEIYQLPELFDTVPGSKDHVIRADSARPETISYMNRNGFKIKSAKKGKGSIEDGVEFLKSWDIGKWM